MDYIFDGLSLDYLKTLQKDGRFYYDQGSFHTQTEFDCSIPYSRNWLYIKSCLDDRIERLEGTAKKPDTDKNKKTKGVNAGKTGIAGTNGMKGTDGIIGKNVIPGTPGIAGTTGIPGTHGIAGKG